MMDSDSMMFRHKLLAIGENLGQEDTEALKFFCIDFIPLKKLETVESAQDIFQFLMNEDLLNEEDSFILAELLYRIKNISLLRKLGYTKEEVKNDLPQRGRVSEFRQMLYVLSEGFTKEEVKDVVFLLRNHIPKKQSTTSVLELLTSLEKQELLTETNLSLLEDICNKIAPDLLKVLTKYKERQDPCTAEELEHMGEHAGSVHSVAENQDVKAGNVQELSLQQPVGNDELKPTVEKSAVYKMDGPHRGYCLIFNNVNFTGDLKAREGSQKDALELERVFTWLGFDVKKYDDKESIEIEELLQNWQSCESWKDSDCLVCCILSHGKSGEIYATDGRLIPIRAITSYFTARQCPLLANKPKLFFIQACQGTKIQQPVYLEPDTQGPDSLAADAQTSGFVSEQQMLSSIPEEADFLLGMATVDGYFSFRHVQHGTWFIQALCDMLRDLVPRGEDVLSILTAVNADVSNRSDSHGLKKQMPQPAYTLRKKLIFPVPSDPFPLL
ncbi:caspase-10-like [Rhineura floridana]|uniref:caspase-10-like n=1 Tax=Rhineura floridana TaxID=261503 RepID=UPI002AC7F9AC|nr:caspase-10-like [Rhineura floridana]